MEIHRTHARLATIRRYGLDLCLGRMVAGDGTVTSSDAWGYAARPVSNCWWTGGPRRPNRSSPPPSPSLAA